MSGDIDILLYDIDLCYEKQVENNKTCSSDKTGFFSQPERALECIYVINNFNICIQCIHVHSVHVNIFILFVNILLNQNDYQ
jgi:hypothetical protein